VIRPESETSFEIFSFCIQSRAWVTTRVVTIGEAVCLLHRVGELVEVARKDHLILRIHPLPVLPIIYSTTPPSPNYLHGSTHPQGLSLFLVGGPWTTASQGIDATLALQSTSRPPNCAVQNPLLLLSLSPECRIRRSESGKSHWKGPDTELNRTAHRFQDCVDRCIGHQTPARLRAQMLWVSTFDTAFLTPCTLIPRP